MQCQRIIIKIIFSTWLWPQLLRSFEIRMGLKIYWFKWFEYVSLKSNGFIPFTSMYIHTYIAVYQNEWQFLSESFACGYWCNTSSGNTKNQCNFGVLQNYFKDLSNIKLKPEKLRYVHCTVSIDWLSFWLGFTHSRIYI